MPFSNFHFASLLPPHFHLWHLPVVFLAGLVGEGYAVAVGGGSILIQFTLASMGMPLSSVVATDLAGCIGADLGVLTAAPLKVWRNKKLLARLTAPFFLGGIIGTLLLVSIPLQPLRGIIIGGLSLLLLYTFMGKNPTLRSPLDIRHIDRWQYMIICAAMLIVGVYTNVSGVGAATFLKLIFIGLLRISVIDSLEICSIAWLPNALISLVVTAISGLIVWPYCVALWVGTFIGSHYAYKLMRRIPDGYLRGFLIIITALYLVYLVASL